MADAAPQSVRYLDDSVDVAHKVTQLALPGLGLESVHVQLRARPTTGTKQQTALSQDPLVQTYLRRLVARGAAPKSVAAYRYQLRSLVLAAERQTGSVIGVVGLLRDTSRLGHALVDDGGRTEGEQLSRWTLAQRRSAVRSFASLMHPELVPLLGEDPHKLLDRALRDVAKRVGTGYRLTGGTPRRRGGQVPTAHEVATVLAAVGRSPGFAGARNRAFFGILAATGARVNALRQLDGAACIVLPSGRMRVFLHEKGKAAQREVELSQAQTDALQEYAEAFNRHASCHGWRVRIRLGAPGPIWLNSSRGSWPYGDVIATLRVACVAANVAPFAPHALRRAFATESASALPRHVVALAGGWRGLERLDDHYVRPRPETIREKLHRTYVPSDMEKERRVVDEATLVL